MKTRTFSLPTLSLALLLCLVPTVQAFFDPTVGRWASRDPIGEKGGLNLSAFVRNNPTTFIDRLGLSPAVPNGPAPDLDDIKTQFLAWYNAQKTLGIAWNNDLPACPCRLDKKTCATIAWVKRWPPSYGRIPIQRHGATPATQIPRPPTIRAQPIASVPSRSRWAVPASSAVMMRSES